MPAYVREKFHLFRKRTDFFPRGFPIFLKGIFYLKFTLVEIVKITRWVIARNIFPFCENINFCYFLRSIDACTRILIPEIK